ncbi:hypothetical protein LK996_11120 [Lysobacter sp. A6]|uniref:SIR2-like domain-containing protein n=1 Tax=Noviluteimonas lactosilytica TaxID=2888523 RepID=A0ABS8JJ40_9GAMM|nr:hypothetical protein [Lysobacter lactosilyticus]MCC8363619.1 hypothetical protein [Lysobacter lactosilyticus]
MRKKSVGQNKLTRGLAQALGREQPPTSYATDRKMVALIVGAGAVQNAWAPVLRAVQPYYDFPLNGDGVNSFLARLVYLLRWFASIGDTNELTKHKTFLAEVRQRICDELRDAEERGELSVRSSFESVVERFVVDRSNTFLLINTNWDEVVDKALLRILHDRFLVTLRPLHVHGSIAHQHMLYLPTEVTREPYRTPEEDKEIGTIHGSIMRGLEGVTHVVVYGLSLSPLDAELCQTLASGWNNATLRQIDVIVPDHDLVANRVNMLLNPKRTVAVTGYHPDQLDTPIDYTVRRD